MPSYGQTVTLQYVAWDTVNNVAKTGDAANHAVRWIKDGVSTIPSNGPAEVDAAAAPGVYRLLLTAAEASCQVGTLCGKSSTSGIAIVPVTLGFENLPIALPGTTNGLPQIGIAPLTNLDATVSSRSTFSGGAVSAVISPVTVGTNNDKAGYSLTAAPPTASQVATAVWQDVITSSDFSATGSVGLFLRTNLDATVSSRSTFSGGAVASVTSPVTVGTNNDKAGYVLATPSPTAAQMASAVWQDLVTGSDFNSASSIGLLLKTNIDAAVSTRSTFAGGAVASVTSPVTVGTNNDKTGYSLATTPPTTTQIASAIWKDLVTSTDFTTANSVGLLLKTNLDATVSSRSTFSGGAVSSVTSPVTVGTNNDKVGYALASPPPTTGQIATAIWQDLVAGSDFNVTGSIGQVLKTNIDAAISTRSTFAGGAVSSVAAPVTITMTQPVPTSNTPQTVGDALNAARAQGFGRWVISGTTLSLYAADGTTVVRTFTLDSASVPTQRS